MKRKYLLLFVLCLFLVSCRSPQERPLDEARNNQRMETNQSSIFRVAPVEYGRIIIDTAEVKDGLGMDFRTIATLKRDDVVKVLDEAGERYVIQLTDNRIGSIDTKDAEPIVREGETDPAPIIRNPQPTAPDTDILPPAGEDIPERLVPPVTNRPEGQPGNFGPNIGNNRPNVGDNTPIIDDNERVPNTNPVERVTDDRGQNTTGNDIESQAIQMVDLVNRERAKNGLPTLAIDQEVARVAGIKSQDMVDQNYFSHYSPTYGSPFEMLDSFGVDYIVAGENLAGNSSVTAAHTALMNSSGHRQNILHPDFTHIGIGVRRSPRYGYVYTQMFIKK